MNTGTGEIVDWNTVLRMRDAGDPTAKFYKAIPKEVLPILEGMNRKQRREWYRKNKKLFSR